MYYNCEILVMRSFELNYLKAKLLLFFEYRSQKNYILLIYYYSKRENSAYNITADLALRDYAFRLKSRFRWEDKIARYLSQRSILPGQPLRWNLGNRFRNCPACRSSEDISSSRAPNYRQPLLKSPTPAVSRMPQVDYGILGHLDRPQGAPQHHRRSAVGNVRKLAPVRQQTQLCDKAKVRGDKH